MEIIIIIALILCNGLFSMSEIAVVSARKARLVYDAKSGSRSAKAALKLVENPDQFLSTVQVGITLIGILTGLYSGDVLAVYFAPILQDFGVPSIYSYTIAKVIIVIVVTYLTIIIGELVPKRIGMSSAEKIAKAIAIPMTWLSNIMFPFVWILSKSTSFIFNLLGIKNTDARITEDEIKMMVKEGTLDGEVQAVEQDIVERVFSLGDRKMESIMTPRNDIAWLDIHMTKEDIRKKISESPFSKYPVINKTLDNLEGTVWLKDLFTHIDSPDFSLKKIIHPAIYFYEGMEVYTALEKMKSGYISMAFISDEFGSVNGLITMSNIVEALIGDIPEVNEEPEIIERKDGSYLVDGQCSFYNFLDHLQLEELYAKYEYNTLSGLILDLLKTIPKTGDQLQWENFNLEIVDMDGVRIDKVLVSRIPQEN